MRLTRILGGLAAVTLACPAYGQDLPRIEPLERSQKTYPNLSPDGRYILFSAGDGFNLNLFVRDIDSSEIVQLTDNRFEDSAANWSPDGEWVVFQRQYSENDGNRDIWLIRADGSESRNFTNTPIVSEQHPRFSPDGQSIYFDGNRHKDDTESGSENYEIYRASIEGSDPERLTANPHWDLYPALSPNGQAMVWMRALPIDEKDDADFEIFLMDLKTGQSRNLSNHARYDTSPDWSPDGEWIAFASDRRSSTRRFTDLYMIRQDGSDLTRLTDGGGESLLYMRPRFSPDGRSLVASRVVAGRTDMIRINLEQLLD